MSLLKGMQPPTRLRGCFVAAEAEKLEPEDRKILLAACKDPAWSVTALERSLRERGVMLSRSTITRHRNGMCQC